MTGTVHQFAGIAAAAYLIAATISAAGGIPAETASHETQEHETQERETQETRARQFMASLTQELLETFGRDALTPLEIRRQFAAILDDKFDSGQMGRQALGDHWPKLAPSEKERYLDAYRIYVIETFVDRFHSPAGASWVALGVRPLPEGRFAVLTRIVEPDGRERDIEWLVRLDGAAKVTDVAVDGALASHRQRSDFGPIVAAKGGLEDLIQALHQGRLPARPAGGRR